MRVSQHSLCYLLHVKLSTSVVRSCLISWRKIALCGVIYVDMMWRRIHWKGCSEAIVHYQLQFLAFHLTRLIVRREHKQVLPLASLETVQRLHSPARIIERVISIGYQKLLLLWFSLRRIFCNGSPSNVCSREWPTREAQWQIDQRTSASINTKLQEMHYCFVVNQLDD